MSIAWPDFAAALGLMFVIEGILPFLSPGRRPAHAGARWRRWTTAMLRIAGAAA